MNSLKTLIAAVLAVVVSWSAQAAVSPEEAAHLGKDLTLFGAEKAGNKEGTIPEYTGGLTTPPPEFKPGSGIYPDPFKHEKPLFTITGANMEQYADKLTEGQKALLRKYSDYRINVYPTHRTVAYPDEILAGTVKNATSTTTADGGLSLKGLNPGLPFPIPKNGHEAMWNHLLRYEATAQEFTSTVFYVSQQGRVVLTSFFPMHVEYPFYQGAKAQLPKTTYFAFLADITAPATLAGQRFMFFDGVELNRKAYQYIPAQRRVKLAPELAYDTPTPSSAGMLLFDDVNIFLGKMDRWSFKLIGKKEMFAPYNNFQVHLATKEQLGTAKFLNPDLVRWELHRFWVIEAELLPGKRHLYSKRTIYWDEDGFMAGMSDQYDHAGKLMRCNALLPTLQYDQKAQYGEGFVQYDFSSGIYVAQSVLEGRPIRSNSDVRIYSQSEWSPENLAGSGSR